MTNIINLAIRYLTLICFFWIGASSSLYAQTISTSINNSCLLSIELQDSSGNIPSIYPPYFFSVGGINQNNNLGQASINVSNLTNGTYSIQVIDGNQNYYTSSITINCGQPPNNGNSGLIDSINQAPTSCTQCNGSGSIHVANPSGTNYTFNWSDGVVGTGSSSHFRNNLCPGIYTVAVSGAQGMFNSVIDITIPCNSAPPQVASCHQFINAYLDHNGIATLLPQDLTSTLIDTVATQAYIVDASNNISNFYTFNCQNLGYYYLTLLFIDSAQQIPDTCTVLVHVQDTIGYCNGSIGNTNGISGATNDASNCSTCDGSYTFIGFIDSLATTPTTYAWSDGVNGSVNSGNIARTDLCPNQNYVLSVSDNSGNIHTTIVNVNCNGTVCIDSNNIDTNFICPQIYTPVCGCDSVTYINACVAQYEYGLTSWTQGACGIGNMSLTINTTADNACDTNSTCNGTANIHVTGGAPPYTIAWSSPNINGFSPTNLCSGSYTITVQDSLTNVVTSIINIGTTGCVWPGDTDDNTVANNFDLLPIGLFYGDTGPARASTGISWAAYQATNWNNQPPLGLPDSKHADCNGDGSIDSLDIAAILANYGQSFFRSSSNSLIGPAPFMVQNATASPGDTISTPIILGDTTNSITNAYGVAFTVNYDPQKIESGSISIDFNNSWLGNGLVNIQKNFNNTGRLEVAVTRTNKSPISGHGSIGSLNFTIKDDVFIGKMAAPDTTITSLTISGVRLISEYNAEIGTSPLTGTISISESTNSNTKKVNNNLDIDCFPNPADRLLTIHSKNATVFNIRLFTATGQLIQTIDNPNTYKNTLPTEKLAAGVYFLSIQTDKGVYNEKLQVTH